MTPVEMPESALMLGGFVLAHAAWSISDAPDLLCPLAIIERGKQRELLRFEAETQSEAISKGKETLAIHGADADCWAFAREGLWNKNPLRDTAETTDVISVDIWARESQHSITLIQRFEPFVKRQRFHLIGEPEVSIDGSLEDSLVVGELLDSVYKGVLQHPKVSPLWREWQRNN